MPEWIIELLKTTVVTAIVSASATIAGVRITSNTSKHLGRRREKIDLLLARDRIEAEANLAERKATLEFENANARRRTEFAEQLLASFYEARRAFDVVRSPSIYKGETAPSDDVSPALAANGGYVVQQRLIKHAELFSRVDSLRFRALAVFGEGAARPFNLLIGIHNRIFHAASDLIAYGDEDHSGNKAMRDHTQLMKRIAFSGMQAAEGSVTRESVVDKDISDMIAAIESLVAPPSDLRRS